MPVYCLPNEYCYQGMDNSDREYEQAKVVSESLDLQNGKGVFVVKTQIDHSA